MKALLLRDEARAELLHETSYYESRRKGSGKRFREAVNASFALMLHFPGAGAPGPANTRRTKVRGFPFTIVYREEESRIVVFAVAPDRQHPAIGFPARATANAIESTGRRTASVMNATLREATASESDFAFAAKREALGPYVEARWGWNDETQRRFHNERWSGRPWQIILLDDTSIGTVSLDWQPDHLRFGEFYLLRAYQRLGIGTRILQGALHQADALRIKTRLEYLKWNPVASLYARHGFKLDGENDTHYFLVRRPK